MTDPKKDGVTLSLVLLYSGSLTVAAGCNVVIGSLLLLFPSPPPSSLLLIGELMPPARPLSTRRYSTQSSSPSSPSDGVGEKNQGKPARKRLSKAEKDGRVFPGEVQEVITECSSILKETGKTYSAYQFATFTLPFFTTLFNHWYHNVEGKNVKVLPSNIAELLTPVALAFWLSSDGSYQKDNGVVILCTDSFTADEVDL
nr:1845_t:CDS:2 [Entrophospora candida]